MPFKRLIIGLVLLLLTNSCYRRPAAEIHGIVGNWRVVNAIPLVAYFPPDSSLMEDAHAMYDSCTGFTIHISDSGFVAGSHSLCFADRDFGFDTSFVKQMEHGFKLSKPTIHTYVQDSAELDIPGFCYYIYTRNKTSTAVVYNTNYTVDNCEFFGTSLSIYAINDNELIIPFCGFELFILKHIDTDIFPPVQPYEGGYIDSFYRH